MTNTGNVTFNSNFNYTNINVAANSVIDARSIIFGSNSALNLINSNVTAASLIAPTCR
ncbi:MAG: hypothetical protein RCG15_08355 [Candidatus Rickettsia vulgarisii]